MLYVHVQYNDDVMAILTLLTLSMENAPGELRGQWLEIPWCSFVATVMIYSRVK